MPQFDFVGRALLSVVRFCLAALLCLGAGQMATAQTATETTLHTFTAAEGTTGGQVIEGADGNYYGVVSGNGVGTFGGIFRLTPSGDYTQLYTFTGGNDGGVPVSLLQGPDGNFYGVAATGGPLPAGVVCQAACQGVAFRLTSSGVFSVLYVFGDDSSVPSSLILGADGNFYGTTLFGSAPFRSSGTIFKLTPAGVYTTLYSFTGGADGGYPQTLVQGSDGYFYGITQALYSGNNGSIPTCSCGTLFRVDTSGNLTTLYTFPAVSAGSNVVTGPASSHKSGPVAQIIITQPGSVTSSGDGAFGDIEDVPHALVEGSDGNFYGAMASFTDFYEAGSGPGQNYSVTMNGTIFRLTPAGAVTTLYGPPSSASPTFKAGSKYGLVFGGDGNLYGSSGNTVFTLTTTGSYTPIYIFTGGQDASYPQFLLPTSSGTFVGTTAEGGSTDTGCVLCGTAFSLAPSTTVPAPVQVSLSPVTAGTTSPLTLTWKALNAFSLTSQQCFAFLSGGSSGGSWSGQQTGTLVAGVYTGSATITPTAAGTYTYALTCGGTISGSATLTVAAPSITTTALPNGVASSPYSATLTASGGLTPYIWSVATGSLPAGLSLDTKTGILSGTPTAAGTTSISFALQDAEAVQVPNVAMLSLTISPALTFTPPSPLTPDLIGTPYGATFAAVGGNPPYTWSIISGSLPTGLSLNASTGTLSGTPTTAGANSFTVQVKDSSALPAIATASTSLTVYPALAIETSSLTSGFTAVPYTATLAASGGNGTYTWSVISGSLPTGLTLAPTTGVLSGTPTAVGTSTFTVQATDSEGTPAKSSASLSIAITAPTLTATPSSVTVQRGSSQTIVIAVSGFAANSISFSCTNLPAGSSCTFSPFSGTGASGTETLTITSALFLSTAQPPSSGRKAGNVALSGILGAALLLCLRRRKRFAALLCALLMLPAGAVLTGCNGGLGIPVASGTYSITVNATTGTQSTALPLQVIVQ